MGFRPWDRSLKSILITLFNGYIRHWKEHIQTTIEPLLSAFYSGRETGNLVYAGYAILHYCSHLFLGGSSLEWLDRKHQQYIDEFLSQVAANQAQMQKWAHHAPMNFQHKFDLLTAEGYRVAGNFPKAIELYDRAIQLATINGYIQEEALANELAAKFYVTLLHQL